MQNPALRFAEIAGLGLGSVDVNMTRNIPGRPLELARAIQPESGRVEFKSPIRPVHTCTALQMAGSSFHAYFTCQQRVIRLQEGTSLLTLDGLS